MSDLHSVRQKVEEGASWRGTIRVTVDGEEMELTVRQLKDNEFQEVMSLIDRDELQSIRGELPEDMMEEYRELQSADDLDEEESERFEELESKLEEEAGGVFENISAETFEGIQRCAKYAVEPDEEDLKQAFVDRAAEIEREYGIKVQEPEDVREALQAEIEEMIDNSVNFVSFTIGIQALVESVGEDEGN